MSKAQKQALERAISKAGGITKLADAIGTRQQNIQYWRKSKVPAEFAPKIEAATGVARQRLRPDIWRAERAA